ECSHNRWWADRILEGWHLGNVYDKESKTAPNMKPYSELDEENKKIDVQFIKKMPIFLHKSGYGLKRI
ncbi:MAG: Ryanodine receptor Ryr, partial [Lentisphaeria bacterium]|nr:Ryanodine receptor Ryr [Lentisphaeria bacterium]